MTPALAHCKRPFRPVQSQSATLAGWYEISDTTVTRAGGTASAVANQKPGGGPLLQSVDINQPSYSDTSWGGSRPGLTFDGTQDLMRADGLAALVTGTDQPFTVILLAAVLTLGSVAGTIRSLWGFGNLAVDNPLHDLRLPASTSGVIASGRRDTAGAAKVKSAAGIIDTNRHIWATVFDGTKVALWRDGVLDVNLDGVASTADSDVGLTDLDTFTVGGITRLVTSGHTHLLLGGLLVFAGALSNAEREKNERYLLQGHPL